MTDRSDAAYFCLAICLVIRLDESISAGEEGTVAWRPFRRCLAPWMALCSIIQKLWEVRSWGYSRNVFSQSFGFERSQP